MTLPPTRVSGATAEFHLWCERWAPGGTPGVSIRAWGQE